MKAQIKEYKENVGYRSSDILTGIDLYPAFSCDILSCTPDFIKGGVQINFICTTKYKVQIKQLEKNMGRDQFDLYPTFSIIFADMRSNPYATII